MSNRIPLKSLIEALAGAVIEAQDSVEEYQLKSLLRFFDKDKRPKSLVMRVPSIRPDAKENEDDLYRAPLLPLMSMNQLRIKDVEISFDAELGQMMAEEASPSAEGNNSPQKAKSTGVSVDIGSPRSNNVGNVHVVLRVEGSEPTDSAARLMNHLTQTQGIFRKG